MPYRNYIALAVIWSTTMAELSAAPSFTYDIMPLLSRAGCNSGGCHGSASGKGNLRLSLRGESPDLDHATLTKKRHGKRLNVSQPDASFLLKKPALLVEHEGDQRFAVDSPDYRLLREWIAAGVPLDPPDAPHLRALTVSPASAVIPAPGRTAQLQATAHFSDDTTRDVTASAVYEPADFAAVVGKTGLVTTDKACETTIIVRFGHLKSPVRLAFIQAPLLHSWETPSHANVIDHHIEDKLRLVATPPSGLCSDQVFVRRLYLDLTGCIPSHAVAKSFVHNPDPNKRLALIDTLLASSQYAHYWTLKWADLLRVDERILDTKGVAAFHSWIHDHVAKDKPLDHFTRAIITAAGSTYTSPPANFYRALREATVRSEAVSAVFLGTQLGCAKCHDHPFERWTQAEYYRFAAVFDRVGYKIIENKRKDKNDLMEFVGEQIVHRGAKPTLKDPRTDQLATPALLGEATTLTEKADPLQTLAAWLTHPQHPLFAKVLTNRLWSHLMGRGIVHPIDDFRLTNPPSNPALLDALTRHFITCGMKAKPLLRLIASSHAYQRDSTPLPANSPDTLNYSHTPIRRLPAEALLDSIHQVLDRPLSFSQYPKTTTAASLSGVALGNSKRPGNFNDLFLREFGKPLRTTTCACERREESSLAQVFTLTSGPGLATLLRDPKNRLTALANPNKSPEAILTELYWHTLTRAPHAKELAHLSPLLTDSTQRRDALEDITWSLLNSKEFILRH